jgi:hypothetical protein
LFIPPSYHSLSKYESNRAPGQGAGSSLLTLGETAADLVPTGPALRVLLVGAYLEDADGVIERIREEVPREATLRFGVACFPGTATTVEELLGRADVGAGLVAG